MVRRPPRMPSLKLNNQACERSGVLGRLSAKECARPNRGEGSQEFKLANEKQQRLASTFCENLYFKEAWHRRRFPWDRIWLAGKEG